MTLGEFTYKWRAPRPGERQGAQEHFLDLCRMLGQEAPAGVDPTGEEWYCFDRGAFPGGPRWADVWRKGHFAWQYSSHGGDLAAAHGHLLRHRELLGSPPLLVVSDLERCRIHANFPGRAPAVVECAFADLDRPEVREVLLALFEDPERLKPGLSVEDVTTQLARKFALLADGLHSRGIEPERAARFLARMLACLFASDAGLLPRRVLADLARRYGRDPTAFADALVALWPGADVVPLARGEIAVLEDLSLIDWRGVEPSLLGTLLERVLDPSKRAQIGAPLTERDALLRIVDPVLIDPLRREWERAKARADALLAGAMSGGPGGRADRARRLALSAIEGFRRRLLDRTVVLDPACGAGNFLCVAVQRLHDLEKEVLLKQHEATCEMAPFDLRVGPQMLAGMEASPFASPLAQATAWMAHVQWYGQNGFDCTGEPLLHRTSAIECRDALLGVRWPRATVVIGHAPALAGERVRAQLGDAYAEALFGAYEGLVPHDADLAAYWLEQARAAIAAGRARRAGLLAPSAIRGGASRGVLYRILESGRIFLAWSDAPWTVEGVPGRVSLVAFDDGTEGVPVLDGEPVRAIHANLTATQSHRRAIDLTRARRLEQNLGIAFAGVTPGGAFSVRGSLAREWLALPPNANRRPNSDVVRPWVGPHEVARHPRDMWIVDFGEAMALDAAALYEAPFEHLRHHVKPERSARPRTPLREAWWRLAAPRPAMRAALGGLSRYLVTPATAQHRLFVWFRASSLPDDQLIAFARADDYFLGVVHSRFHEMWAHHHCAWHGEGELPCYSASATFETFPFPAASEEHGNAVAAAAADLIRRRDAWLSPRGASARDMRGRTLSRLYDERPVWLSNAHAALDASVAAAYGWDAAIGEEECLDRLLDLNLSRGRAGGGRNRRASG